MTSTRPSRSDDHQPPRGSHVDSRTPNCRRTRAHPDQPGGAIAMRVLPWLVGGGAAAVALYSWTRRKQDGTPASRNGAPLPGHWVWPVGVWHGRKPEISDGFWGLRRQPGGYLMTHGGVDIMYR